jgi:hypothetical protein
MADYNKVFTESLYTPEAKYVVRAPTKVDLDKAYDNDVKIDAMNRGGPRWGKTRHCQCGRVAHLKGTSSSVPVFPMWDTYCIKTRDTPILKEITSSDVDRSSCLIPSSVNCNPVSPRVAQDCYQSVMDK